MSEDNKPARAIFVTLKEIVVSKRLVSVEELRQSTGFGRRRVQRHVELLTDVGVIKRVGDCGPNGYRYISTLPLSFG